ncbi:MAG: hypothetical protein ACI37Z_01105 [Candidatus Gastranaerophilaceae bacterium]
MANICMNYIKVFSTSEQLKKLYGLLEKWTENSMLDFVHKNDVLNVLYQAGIGLETQTIEDIQNNGYRLTLGKRYTGRAYITDSFILSLPDESERDQTAILEIFTDSAWQPDISVWKRICDKYIGEDQYDLYFESEEPGNDIFVTNDPDYLNNYYFTVYDDEYEEKFAEIGLESYMTYPPSQITYSLRKLFNDNLSSEKDLITTFNQKYAEIASLSQFEAGEIEDY